MTLIFEKWNEGKSLEKPKGSMLNEQLDVYQNSAKDYSRLCFNKLLK